jgi:pimeloyl-ACP methyl ester carboxylesterase
VVLVHGLPGTAYDWAPLSAELVARNRRVLAYDRLGYGHSDPRPDDSFSVEANARDLIGLLENADLRDATVVGWSYGGPVAIRAAVLDGSRIGRLVLVGSGGPSDDPQEPPAIYRLLFSRPVLAWIKRVPPLARGLRSALSRQAFSEGPQPDWWLTHLNANLDQAETLRTWREEGAHERPDELDPAAAGRPILIVHGDDDRLAPVAIGEWLHRHAPGSRLEVVEGGSHMLPITHAAFLADQIAAFGDPNL